MGENGNNNTVSKMLDCGANRIVGDGNLEIITDLSGGSNESEYQPDNIKDVILNLTKNFKTTEEDSIGFSFPNISSEKSKNNLSNNDLYNNDSSILKSVFRGGNISEFNSEIITSIESKTDNIIDNIRFKLQNKNSEYNTQEIFNKSDN